MNRGSKAQQESSSPLGRDFGLAFADAVRFLEEQKHEEEHQEDT